MNTYNITRTTFTAAMEAAVATRGADYVYQKGASGICVYVKHGKPDCLIGCVLYTLGVPIEMMSVATGAEVLLQRFLGVYDDPTLLEAARYAQFWQDHDKTWGEALAVYHSILEGDRVVARASSSELIAAFNTTKQTVEV